MVSRGRLESVLPHRSRGMASRFGRAARLLGQRCRIKAEPLI